MQVRPLSGETSTAQSTGTLFRDTLAGEVRAAIVMSGISAAVGIEYAGTEDELLQQLMAAGRRTLGLGTPRVN